MRWWTSGETRLPCLLQRLLLTYDSGVVVVRQHPLTQCHQQPEGFLLRTVEQQDGGDNVHRLKGEGGENMCHFLFILHHLSVLILLLMAHQFSDNLVFLNVTENHFTTEYTYSLYWNWLIQCILFHFILNKILTWQYPVPGLYFIFKYIFYIYLGVSSAGMYYIYEIFHY